MFSSIRVRLTLWYLLIFGSLLVVFSIYMYSLVSSDMHKRFDYSLLRTSQSMANYFSEFSDRDNIELEAQETIDSLKEGRESAAIFREGRLLAANNDDVVAAVKATRVLDAGPTDRKTTYATQAELNKRLVVFPFQYQGVNYVSAVLEPLDKLEGEIGHIRKLFLVGFSAVLVLAAVGGFLLAQKSLQPMVTISAQAEHINARNLSERLKVTNSGDELGRLAGVFNALLSRLDTSFEVMREFMADASHELRTPLTIIHGEAQVSLSHEHTAEEYRQSLAAAAINGRSLS
jgi:signal transduction histidine kinase